MAKTFVIGDIHGAYKTLVQCLERSGFNKEEDTLIQLGDVVDGWNEVYECVEELLTIKNLIAIKGNHDDWFREFCIYRIHPTNFQQGGEATRSSYNKHLGINNIPYEHMQFFDKQHLYYVDDQNRLFVHAGFDKNYLINEQHDKSVFYWDRGLWMNAVAYCGVDNTKMDKNLFFDKNKFKEIYLGHTATTFLGFDKPLNAANIWNLDTGAGYKGRLTIMDINNKDYWQSDPVQELYNDQKGRN